MLDFYYLYQLDILLHYWYKHREVNGMCACDGLYILWDSFSGAGKVTLLDNPRFLTQFGIYMYEFLVQLSRLSLGTCSYNRKIDVQTIMKLLKKDVEVHVHVNFLNENACLLRRV